ncbi:MAG: hypothetical protein ACO3G5_07330, partial [Flavobacteriaceae bacterium]
MPHFDLPKTSPLSFIFYSFSQYLIKQMISKFSFNHSSLLKVVFIFLFTSFTASAQTYYWNIWDSNQTGYNNADLQTPANWVEVSGTNPTTFTVPTTLNPNGVYIVDATINGTRTPGNSIIIIYLTGNISVGQFLITGNSEVKLRSRSVASKITITGGASAAGDDFGIDYLSKLELSHYYPVAIEFSGDGNTGKIAGTYSVYNPGNIITTTGGTNTVVTVTGTGSVINSEDSSDSALIGSTSTLFFDSGSDYKHTYFNINSGYIPLATWDEASTITLVNNNNTSSHPATVIQNTSDQTFGNIIFELQSSQNTEFVQGTAVVKGNFTVNNSTTNGSKFIPTKFGTLTIHGDLTVENNSKFE